jgi:ribosomal L38e-like protein
MPKEIKDKAQFEKLLESATEVRVSRSGDDAKLKVRSRDALYTFKTTGAEADAIVKGTKATVVEF